MRYLYVDNFRGFSKTLIPVSRVNFLVGQNSTGKSSILMLLNLFSSPGFWRNAVFNNDEVQFGNFKDIVSIHSKSSDYFSIGYIENRVAPKRFKKRIPERKFAKGVLLTFKDRGGLPYLYQFTFNDATAAYTFRETKKGAYYKYEKINVNIPGKTFSTTIFEKWKLEHLSDSLRLKKIPKTIFDIKNDAMPLAFFPLLFMELIKKEGEKQRIGEYFFPNEFVPIFLRRLVWLAPIRTKPKRTYDSMLEEFSPEGAHTPYVIRKFLSSKKDADAFQSEMKKFGKESGLFEKIGTKDFGKKSPSPFEVDVFIDKKGLNINNVGYGVSQSLPVIVEMISRPVGHWFAVQQPEVHLHPKAQSALGDLIFGLALREKKGYFIETHSDFTIDRFRLNYRRKLKEKPNAQVLFFERKNKNNLVTSIPISSNGDLSSDQPLSYRDFFIKEEFEILGL